VKKVLVAICFLSSLTILGQGKGNCAEYSNKKAEKKFKKMRDYDYPMDRSGTIRKMKELVDKYSGYPELIAFIAGHYHKSSYKKMNPGLKINVRDSAKEWFTKLSETCPAYQGHLAYYWLGRMNHEDGNDSLAAVYFKSYLENESEPPREYKKIATQLRDEFFVKKELLANPVDFNPKDVKGVSTEHDEYLPMLSPDNEWAYFTRKRNTSPDITLPVGTPGNDGKEYFTRSKAMTIDSFSRGMALTKPFNMYMQPLLNVGGNNKLKGLGGACLTPDNKTMYITANILFIPLRGNGYTNTELMKTKYKNGQWGPLKPVGSINNEQGEATWEGQPTISSDGNLMVFSSARLSSTTFGKEGEETYTLDLFYTIKDENGRWGPPKNLGPLVNTKGQEKTPFLHTDSKTLYFASNGHPGVGGYDIYYTRMDKNGNWIKPKNIGYPINTEKDEHGLIVSLDGKTAYFTRGDQGNASTGGLNLVSFGLHKNARPEKVVMMKGNLKDENGIPVKNGKISVTDKSTGEVHEGLVDEETGEYVVVMPVKDPDKKEIEPEKISLTVNGEDVEADYGSEVKKIGDKEVIVPPGGKIVSVNKKEQVIAKDERIAEINGKEEVIKKSDKVREIEGKDVVVPSDHEIVDVNGEQKVVPMKNEGNEKQRFVVSATGDGKAFSTKVVEIDPDEVDGAKKIYPKEPIKIETLSKDKPIRLNEVNFATNSFVLNGKSMDILDELVNYLKLKSTMQIEIHGHTDNVGDSKKNLLLSQNRADAVMKFLISSGISPERLSAKGFGQTKPNKSNATEKGRAFNRRVEFIIKKY
tara:strand:+ start:4093 stop:6522 length:2430 start_codon:yes stop_codon:yes gene_type:complete